MVTTVDNKADKELSKYKTDVNYLECRLYRKSKGLHTIDKRLVQLQYWPIYFYSNLAHKEYIESIKDYYFIKNE